MGSDANRKEGQKNKRPEEPHDENECDATKLQKELSTRQDSPECEGAKDRRMRY